MGYLTADETILAGALELRTLTGEKPCHGVVEPDGTLAMVVVDLERLYLWKDTGRSLIFIRKDMEVEDPLALAIKVLEDIRRERADFVAGMHQPVDKAEDKF
jgi:hypothetical protein